MMHGVLGNGPRTGHRTKLFTTADSQRTTGGILHLKSPWGWGWEAWSHGGWGMRLPTSGAAGLEEHVPRATSIPSET